MSIDNKSRQAAFRQRMRLAGKKVITLWVSAEEEQAIRAILKTSGADSQEEANACAAKESPPTADLPRRKPIKTGNGGGNFPKK